MLNLILVKFFLSIADHLLNFIWVYLALNSKKETGDFGYAIVIIIQIILFRLLFFWLANKYLKKLNFYSQYIICFTAGFIIVLIGTRMTDLSNLIYIVFLKEIFSSFRVVSQKEYKNEFDLLMEKNVFIFRLLFWVEIFIAALVISFYIQSNNISNIFAAIAVLFGLPMIILYNKFSKKYLNMPKKILAIPDSKRGKKEIILLTALALLIVAVYVLVGSSVNINYAFIIMGVGLLYESLLKVVNRKFFYLEYDYFNIVSFLMALIIGVLFVV